jgi:sugar/nucleoside kinase (ribokinase family)
MPKFDVTLVGEANSDLLLYGLPEDLPPERELLADKMALLLGGSPAITAHNLAALGSSVGFITATAGDVFAQLCLQDLAHAGVDLSCIVRAPAGIGTGITVFLQHATFRRALTYPGTTTTLRYSDLNLDYLKSSRHFHLASLFLQRELANDVPRLFAELKSAGLTISLDTNDDPEGNWAGPVDEALRYVDILMPNEQEACALAGTSDIDDAIERLTKRVPLLVLKRGARGALVQRGGERHLAAPLAVAFIDAVGAGDSFNAGFLHAYVHGLRLERCLEFGNLAGALSTTATGGTTAFRNREASNRFFEQHLGAPGNGSRLARIQQPHISQNAPDLLR